MTGHADRGTVYSIRAPSPPCVLTYRWGGWVPWEPEALMALQLQDQQTPEAGSVSDHRKEANIERKQVTWIFISQLIKKLCAPYRVCVRSVAQSSPTPPYRVRVCVCVLSCSVKSNSLWPHGLQPARLLCPGKDTGVGCHALLRRIFLTQGLNLCLLHWQVDSLPLSHLGSLSTIL